MSRAQVQITILTEEQIEQIHKDTLQVLSTTGIRVDSKRARAVFSKAIGNSADEERVRIPHDLVEQALASVPSSVQLFNR